MRLEKTRGYSFIEMFIVVIKWSIYVLFLNFALLQLGIPEFTEWLTSILVVIPSLSGALILITIGFAIATYLKMVIEDSKIDGWETLSQIFYFFTMYIFLVFAFKTALYALDSMTTNILVVILSTIIVAGYVFWKIRKK